MCTGGRLIADFVAGTDARPGLNEDLEEHLTTTVDGLWVVWAYKLARQEGDLFVPLTGGSGYPADAKATCKLRGRRGDHDAPNPRCTCGFHAVSSRKLDGLPVGHGFSELTVALSGRVLAFEWHGGGLLWRAERQTVVRTEQPSQIPWPGIEWPTRFDRAARARLLAKLRDPGDPDGRTAVVHPAAPRDSGPIRLSLPVSAPVLQLCHDDAGWCVGAGAVEHSPASLVLA
jgi:hypothetical protein